jgi:glucose/arabinose dehydrogenase
MNEVKDWWVFPGFEIEQVATDLSLPVNLAFAQKNIKGPKAPFLYINELYGQVKVVTNDGTINIYAKDLLNYKPDFKIPGSGESGLTGICVEPKSGDLFLSMIYMDNDKPKAKVVRAKSQDGLKIDSMETVIDNIPSILGAHQIQAVSIGFDNKLYVNLGDGMIDSNVAQDDKDFRGKILKMNLDGSDVSIFAKGFRNPFGGVWRNIDKSLYISDNGPAVDDRIAEVEEGKNYGWPKTMRQNSIFWWHYTQGITALDFMQEGQFSSDFQNNLFVALFGGSFTKSPTKGKKIVKIELDKNNAVKSCDDFARFIGEGFSSPCGLAFGPDGLYFSDLYGENFDPKTLVGGTIYKIKPKKG